MCPHSKFLTTVELKKIVETKLGSSNFMITKLIESNIEERAGYMADHLYTEIEFERGNKTYDDQTKEMLSCFTKVLPAVETFRKLVVEIRGFEKEALFYEKIAKDFEKILNNVKTFPTCYFATKEAVVLENVRKEGFTPIKEPRKAVDYDHCKQILSALARFHSASIVMEKTSKVNLKELYPEMLRENIFTEEGIMGHWLDTGLRACQDLVPLMTEYKSNPTLIMKIQQKIVELKPTFLKFFEYDPRACYVISHGDSWTSNFLFQYNHNKPTQAIIVDFQGIRYAPPAFDIKLFLYYALEYDGERQQKMNQLEDYYYECLTVELQRNNLDVETILSKADFKASCENAALMGSTAACLYYHVSQLNSECIENIFGNPTLYMKFMSKDRSEELKKCFETDTHFRHVMRNAMLNLIQLLLAN